MSVFDDAAEDILEGFGDAITVPFQSAQGPARDVRIRWLDPYVEIDAEGRSVMDRDHHAIGLASALSDANQGDTLIHDGAIWTVIRPKASGAFVSLQVARVGPAPENGSP